MNPIIDNSVPIPDRKETAETLTDEIRAALASMLPNQSILLPTEQAAAAVAWFKYREMGACRKKETLSHTRVWRTS